MRERNLSKHRTASDSEIGLGQLIHAAKQHDDLYSALLETLSHLRHVLESDFEPWVPIQFRSSVVINALPLD